MGLALPRLDKWPVRFPALDVGRGYSRKRTQKIKLSFKIFVPFWSDYYFSRQRGANNKRAQYCRDTHTTLPAWKEFNLNKEPTER